jgi:hypothetical protein
MNLVCRTGQKWLQCFEEIIDRLESCTSLRFCSLDASGHGDSDQFNSGFIEQNPTLRGLKSDQLHSRPTTEPKTSNEVKIKQLPLQ